jgi:hypothetical protein
VRTILRRVAANKLGLVNSIFSTILWFKLMIPFEGVHPLEGGAFRMKFRKDRRHGLPIENPFVFYPRFAWESARKLRGYWKIYREAKQILNEVKNAPDRWTYSDIAIAPPKADEFEALDLYHATTGGEAALARKRRDEAIRAGAGVETPPAVAAE